ncbi:sensor domain-containing diguanylate cyclase [Neptuniibacter caesariensis]|uniref:Sensory box/GGDEF domain protein n=1 Tax=Neptuniibacter caesariensis TaxID=207954 RepID=A0A7U8C7K7_NEPCE|nr:sensor domain-containing diguanylate cyclase [Neptuniibacter caesariensis]EAR61565.1 sensory box/GGDEF domain protein [Oceanospirillum sp. MED92] [Neptuniibacter caesariensis]
MFSKGDHKFLYSSLNSIGACVAVVERQTNHFNLISGNELFADLVGEEISRIVARELSSFLPRYVVKDLQAHLKACCEDQESQEYEQPIDLETGTTWWRFILSPIISNENTITRVMITAIDITEKVGLESSLQTAHERFEAIIESAYDGIVVINGDEDIEYMNESACDMFGFARDEIISKKLDLLIPKKYRSPHKAHVDAFKSSPIKSRQMHARASVVGLRKDGEEFPVEVTISKIAVGDGYEMTAVIRDISERSALMEELRKAAVEDALTKTYNRRHLDRILHRELARSQRFGHTFSVVLFDLDNFKQINDEYGHAIGDQVLISLVDAVNDQIREVDVFGRWGGDEFMLVLPETNLETATVWAERFWGLAVDEFFNLATTDMGYSFSGGITQYRAGDDTVEKILKRCDRAMYKAKENGRATFESE